MFMGITVYYSVGSKYLPSMGKYDYWNSVSCERLNVQMLMQGIIAREKTNRISGLVFPGYRWSKVDDEIWFVNY